MQKLKYILCIPYTVIKLSFIKLLHLKNFKFSWKTVLTPFTTIEMSKGSELNIGKKFKMLCGSRLRVRKNGKVMIGDHSGLNYGCMITAHEEIIIGSDVMIGPNVLIYDHDHDFKSKDGMKNMKYITEKVEIGDGTWIGANVVILRGTKIGKHCVVSAGAVVKGDYPDYSLIIQKRQEYVDVIKRDG